MTPVRSPARHNDRVPSVPPAERSAPLSVDGILDAAQRLVESGGLGALSMRKLAAELGVAVTAIYWHVGNREALVARLVERIVEELGSIRPKGDTPRDRLLSIASVLRRRLLARPHLVGLVHEMGRTAVMFQPAQLAMARELTAAGVTGEAGARALRAIEYHVIGFAVLERTIHRMPEQRPTTEELWRDEPPSDIDPATAAALAEPADEDELFETGLRALVDSLLSRP